MSLSLDVLVQILQIVVMLAGFGGMAFTLGRMFQMVSQLQKSHDDVKVTLFGKDGQGGMFLTRESAKLMLDNATQEHEAFDRRLNDLSSRIGVLESRR